MQPDEETSTDIIKSWHAHVYYDAASYDQATQVCAQASRLLPVVQGRMHQKPVGPHPMWSCQLAFESDALSQVVSWLTLNRRGLTVFVHPNTGDDLSDHRDRAIWLGQSQNLKLSIFGA